MIVIRIHAPGRRVDVQSTKPEVVLGSDPTADVVERGAGWAPREAVLVHRGTEVELRSADGHGHLRMRLGDSVRLGRARITLVGLLPLPEPEHAAPAAAPSFGGYEDEGIPEQPFQLVDELAPPPPAAPTPPPPPPAPTAPPPPPAPAAPPRSRPPARAPAEASASGKPAPPRNAPSPPPSRKGLPPLPRPPAPAFGHAEFGEELVRQLKRAPFFLTSLALHALVFFVLVLLQVAPDTGLAQNHPEKLQADLQQPEEPPPEEFELAQESALPILDDVPLPELPAEEPHERAAADESQDLEALPAADPLPFTVGTNPSLNSVDAGTGRKLNRISPRELAEVFTEGDARTANAKAADYVRAQLVGPGRAGDPLKKLTRGQVLVVGGTFDHIDRVLEALRIPFLFVPARTIAMKDAPDLAKHKIVFWNCGEALPEEQRRIACRRIREFVKDGGFLFSTDWSVANLLADAFPGYLRTQGPRITLPETVIQIGPARGQADNPLLRGVFHSSVGGRWWLEQASFDVQPAHRDVVTLIESKDLSQTYHRSPAVAVTFPYGRGRVLHVVGHYYQEAGNLAGTISAQRLALNFVLMRLEKD